MFLTLIYSYLIFNPSLILLCCFCMCFWSYLSVLIMQTAHDWLLPFVVDTEAVRVCHKPEAPRVCMTP